MMLFPGWTEQYVARVAKARLEWSRSNDTGWCCTREVQDMERTCRCDETCECYCVGCPDCEFRGVKFG